MELELQRSFQLSGGSGIGAGFDAYLGIILGIMIAAGLLGGIANHFLAEHRERGKNGSEPPAARSRLRYPVLGIVVALTAPLFLRMLSSDLVDAARVRATEFFVFAGFCICYVIATRGIVDAVAARVAEQWRLLRRDIDDFERLSRAKGDAVAADETGAAVRMVAKPAAKAKTETVEMKMPAAAAREETRRTHPMDSAPVSPDSPAPAAKSGGERQEIRQEIRQDARQDAPRTEYVRTNPEIPDAADVPPQMAVETRIEPRIESRIEIPQDSRVERFCETSRPSAPPGSLATPEEPPAPPASASGIAVAAGAETGIGMDAETGAETGVKTGADMNQAAAPADDPGASAAVSAAADSVFEPAAISGQTPAPEKRLSPQAQSAIELLSYNDVEIMYVIAAEAAVYGNLSALTEKTGLNRDLLGTRLTMLKNLGLIETRIDEENILHWFVTDKGKEILNELFAGQRKNRRISA